MSVDWTHVKAGDPIESAVIGHRVWRYRLGPPLTLLSFCLGSSRPWLPGEVYEAHAVPRLEDKDVVPGVYAFRTLAQLRRYFRDLPGTLRYQCVYENGRSNPAWFDGVVRGTVMLWGACVDHRLGYRAQFARPVSFDEIYGADTVNVLTRLERMFL